MGDVRPDPADRRPDHHPGVRAGSARAARPGRSPTPPGADGPGPAGAGRGRRRHAATGRQPAPNPPRPRRRGRAGRPGRCWSGCAGPACWPRPRSGPGSGGAGWPPWPPAARPPPTRPGRRCWPSRPTAGCAAPPTDTVRGAARRMVREHRLGPGRPAGHAAAGRGGRVELVRRAAPGSGGADRSGRHGAGRDRRGQPAVAARRRLRPRSLRFDARPSPPGRTRSPNSTTAAPGAEPGGGGWRGRGGAIPARSAAGSVPPCGR